MLRAAGVEVESHPALVDEASIKESLLANGAKARDIADALAEAKARKVSGKYPAALVLGCDQILVTASGQIFDKPENPDDAREHLTTLSGTTHRLISTRYSGNSHPAIASAGTASKPKARSCLPA